MWVLFSINSQQNFEMHVVPEHQEICNLSKIGHAYMRNNSTESTSWYLWVSFSLVLRTQKEGWLCNDYVLWHRAVWALMYNNNKKLTRKPNLNLDFTLFLPSDIWVSWIWGSVFLICKVDVINPTLTVFSMSLMFNIGSLSFPTKWMFPRLNTQQWKGPTQFITHL